MNLGIFGGSFDPVHMGHLILAEQCREQAGLDRVLFIPAARPPHKPDIAQTPFRNRVEMLELALSGNPAFAIDELENERDGPSYTVDTLDAIHKRDGVTPWLILGADSVVDLPMWYQPRRILELAGLLVVGRPGSPPPDIERLRTALGVDTVRMQTVVTPQVDIASREVRARVAAGKSIRYLVPRAVEAYIVEKRLYV